MLLGIQQAVGVLEYANLMIEVVVGSVLVHHMGIMIEGVDMGETSDRDLNGAIVLAMTALGIGKGLDLIVDIPLTYVRR
jgi:hypothetical protein